jgi:hypothetical protein
MSESAFQTAYRSETIATFEQRYSDLRLACVQEAVIKGNSAVFLVAGSNGATAVTRGINGQIPFGDDVLSRILRVREEPDALADLQSAALASLKVDAIKGVGHVIEALTRDITGLVPTAEMLSWPLK